MNTKAFKEAVFRATVVLVIAAVAFFVCGCASTTWIDLREAIDEATVRYTDIIGEDHNGLVAPYY